MALGSRQTAGCVGGLVLAIWCTATSALASLDTCLDRSNAPHERIDACAMAIEGGGLDDAELAAAHRGKGTAYSDSGLYREAIPELTRASRLDPADTTTWLARAVAFTRVGSLEGARIDYRRVLRLDPLNLEASRGCADALTKLGYEDQLERALDNACAIVTFVEPAYSGRQTQRESFVASDSTSSTTRTRREFDDAVLDLLEKMRDAQRAGDWFRAAIYHSQAMETDPDAVLCRWALGWGFDGYMLRQYDMLLRPELYEEGAVPRTLAEVQAALSTNPQDADALRERGLLFAESGAAFNAVDDLDAALETDPESVDLMILSTKARTNVLKIGPLFRQFPHRSRSYLKPDAMLERVEEAIRLGADDLMTHVTHEAVLQWQPNAFEDPVLVGRRIAALERAIELLPTWPEQALKRHLAYRLYMDRGSALSEIEGWQVFADHMALALHPPGVESSLYDPRCYLP